MKPFILSVLTLALLTAAVTANGNYVVRISEETIALVGEAEDPSANVEERRAAVGKIEKLFDDNMSLLSVSVGHDELSVVRCYVADAKRQTDGDRGQYLAALDKIAEEMEKIVIASAPKVDGII